MLTWCDQMSKSIAAPFEDFQHFLSSSCFAVGCIDSRQPLVTLVDFLDISAYLLTSFEIFWHCPCPHAAMGQDSIVHRGWGRAAGKLHSEHFKFLFSWSTSALQTAVPCKHEQIRYECQDSHCFCAVPIQTVGYTSTKVCCWSLANLCRILHGSL